jgi:hypothetical protein
MLISVLLLLLPAAFLVGPSTVGTTQETHNGQYHFANATSPWLIGISLMFILLYAFLMNGKMPEPGKPISGVVRRFAAFYVDFFIAMLMCTPILGIIPALFEWRRTGMFKWNFQRVTPAPSDTVLIDVLVPVCFVVLFGYFIFPLLRGRPSPGTCIFGYLVVSEDVPINIERAALRILLGFVAAGLWPFAFLGRDRERGRLWFDRVTRTRAVRLFDV